VVEINKWRDGREGIVVRPTTYRKAAAPPADTRARRDLLIHEVRRRRLPGPSTILSSATYHDDGIDGSFRSYSFTTSLSGTWSSAAATTLVAVMFGCLEGNQIASKPACQSGRQDDVEEEEEEEANTRRSAASSGTTAL